MNESGSQESPDACLAGEGKNGESEAGEGESGENEVDESKGGEGDDVVPLGRVCAH